MRIGILDIDNQAKVMKYGSSIYPNLALCKIAAYHRQHGDTVEWAMPLFEHYDIIYRSKIFNFTPDDDRTYDTVPKPGGHQPEGLFFLGNCHQFDYKIIFLQKIHTK